MLATPSLSNMPAWYLLQLDSWQLGLKNLNSATELPSDSVAQFVRAWQAICQVAGLTPLPESLSFSPPLSFSLFLTFFLTDFVTWVKV